jgi:hypothetical protein
MFCQYSRGGEKESAGEVAEKERDRPTRMTRHNQKVSTPSINSLHKLQEVYYFEGKVKRELTYLRLTSDIQYQHSSIFLLLVRKCDIVV